jgi:hypothetical protein
LESGPAPTSNYFAAGAPTVRIYWVYEAVVENLELRRALVALSHSHPVEVLERLALEQYRSGRRGWASSVAVMALGEVVEAFRSLPPGERAKPLPFRQTTLAGNVAAVLDDVDDPRYQRIG